MGRIYFALITMLIVCTLTVLPACAPAEPPIDVNAVLYSTLDTTAKATLEKINAQVAAMDAQLPGWHLPSEAEWDALTAELGSAPGTKLKAGGSSGFNGVFAGHKAYDGSYIGSGQFGQFWTSTINSSDHSGIRSLFSHSSELESAGCGHHAAMSVRYIKD